MKREKIILVTNDKKAFGEQLKREPGLLPAILKSVRRIKEFNLGRTKEINVNTLELDFGTPFIRIGKVPLLTYQSKKEGKLKNYKHETKKMPTMYMHPDKPIAIIVGGSLKVRDWLYD